MIYSKQWNKQSKNVIFNLYIRWLLYQAFYLMFWHFFLCGNKITNFWHKFLNYCGGNDIMCNFVQFSHNKYQNSLIISLRLDHKIFL